MLRLAFDFIITWRETRTRPNAYEQLTEGSEPYFPLPAFPQDDIWPELLEKIISYSKKTK